ncbi:MAG: carbon storage regulator CsrA [Planctomycetes bacterium]|nr:carbon storage regulator CsrA [Planctomycetota bacterium]
MLVLSRQKDQTIMIGDNIEITVVDIRGDKVRLGISAPTMIPVHRKEVYDAIQKENRDAATVRLEDITDLSRRDKIIDDKKDSGPNAHKDPPKADHE